MRVDEHQNLPGSFSQYALITTSCYLIKKGYPCRGKGLSQRPAKFPTRIIFHYTSISSRWHKTPGHHTLEMLVDEEFS